jgi:3-deoxy-D-manno-octulosonate 8-phosphate phosphatase (KDO 8-P phosphatase)
LKNSTNKINLIILDVDGVMTDGTKYYDTYGNVCMKRFCDKDFTAIKILIESGVNVCCLSSDNRVNSIVMERRHIDFYCSQHKKKDEFVPMFKEKYGCTAKEMLYIGDDLYDIPLMKKVGFPYCPCDAAKEVQKICGTDNTLISNGGSNVIMELLDLCITRGLVNIYDIKM